MRYLVSAPPPGPTSSNLSKGFFVSSPTIFLQMFSSFRKCCPSDFFRVYIPAKIDDAPPIKIPPGFREGFRTAYFECLLLHEFVSSKRFILAVADLQHIDLRRPCF